jgi:hypothetical protein
VDNKSHDYSFLRLDRDSGGWRALAPAQDDSGDVAFEDSKTGNIISLNSVCREYRDASLEELSHYLLLGLNTTGPVESRDTEVDGSKALESTVNATMSRPHSAKIERASLTPVVVRAVVLRKSGCTYDLMYIARPEAFEAQLGDFERFLKGFHVQ